MSCMLTKIKQNTKNPTKQKATQGKKKNLAAVCFWEERELLLHPVCTADTCTLSRKKYFKFPSLVHDKKNKKENVYGIKLALRIE